MLTACAFWLTACATRYDQAERDRNYAIFVATAKVGLRFEDVRAQLVERKLTCSEPHDQTGKGDYRVSLVALTHGFSRMATFKESTGWDWLPNGPSMFGVIEMNAAGVITRVR